MNFIFGFFLEYKKCHEIIKLLNKKYVFLKVLLI